MLLIQLQILLDCSDGELARWRGVSSPAGIYLDRLGHYLTEAALPIALGIRADGGWDSIGGWTTSGCSPRCSCCSCGPRRRSSTSRAPRRGCRWSRTPPRSPRRAGGLARLRRSPAFAPFFRAFVAMEFTLLALGAAIVDAARGRPRRHALRWSSRSCRSRVTAVGHLVAILSSQRLR